MGPFGRGQGGFSRDEWTAAGRCVHRHLTDRTMVPGTESSYAVVRVDVDGRPATLLIYHEHWQHYVQILGEAMSASLVIGPLDRLASEITGVLCWKIPATVLARLPNLRWIQVTSSGTDQLTDFLASVGSRPRVASVRGMNAESVAQFVMLSILAHHWELPTLLERQRHREWTWHSAVPLDRMTCGIIGLGSIGQKVAHYASTMGMRVIGSRRRVGGRVDGVDRLFGPEHLEELLGEADYVVLTVPLTPASRGLIGAAQIRAMKASAVLVNVARGGVVDEVALRTALEEERLRGASVDVTEAEPLPPDDPLWAAPRLILTPHTAGERSDHREAVAAIWIENIRRFMAGSLLRNELTP